MCVLQCISQMYNLLQNLLKFHHYCASGLSTRIFFKDPQLIFRNVCDPVAPLSKQLHFCVSFRGSRYENREPSMPSEVSLSLRDILPTNPKYYDKNRAPKPKGQPTTVYFHVTVLSLDSINEESMVR